jgi:hypothetical protein
MKFLITRWNPDPSYPNPRSSPSAVFPVQRALKFSTVLGTVLLGQLHPQEISMFSSLSIKSHDDPTHGLSSMFNIKVDLYCQIGDRTKDTLHTLLVMIGPFDASAC